MSTTITAESPCCNVCKLDATQSYCTGCFRTRGDIGVWSRATDQQKIEINKRAYALAAKISDQLNSQKTA